MERGRKAVIYDDVIGKYDKIWEGTNSFAINTTLEQFVGISRAPNIRLVNHA